MALATANEQGHPSVRMVLMRGLDQDGFRFYTNRESRKGDELAAKPWAAIAFYWEPPGLQLRAGGPGGGGGPGGARGRGARRRLLRVAATREPAGRLGQPAEPGAGVARAAARCLCAGAAALRGAPGGTAPALGRVSAGTPRDRVLGTRRAPAAPAPPVPPKQRR